MFLWGIYLCSPVFLPFPIILYPAQSRVKLSFPIINPFPLQLKSLSRVESSVRVEPHPTCPALTPCKDSKTRNKKKHSIRIFSSKT